MEKISYDCYCTHSILSEAMVFAGIAIKVNLLKEKAARVSKNGIVCPAYHVASLFQYKGRLVGTYF
ncbi:hypothetical protein SAMN05216587_101223 [Selenomonas ruminantium]|uniref:Uncharacterized protein n=1 Tax=Selenomonas ruminantium TaxID=971 RepID=A0A1I0V389_SELRU|nr:hypothetical protein SAMN05216587_101223 [Selenomonas ruminantium]